MAVHRVATVGVGGFTHRTTSRSNITVGGQRRIVGTTIPPKPISIGGAQRVTRVARGSRGSTGTSGGGGRPSGKTRGR